ncbi:hypothetical protein QJS04_geneDACA017497 [Acorus gramineus]|uniref:Uncharacterized protein n=1 Tax=Acorus gramineus TaxID=55184 RepID=A0AAV9AHQ1_ACOGR|nr:hypothetical protein QJS04_geneDACA017497 [Acorus gramineus]
MSTTSSAVPTTTKSAAPPPPSAAIKPPPPPRPPSTTAPRPLSTARPPNPSQPPGMLYSMGAPTRAFPIKNPASAGASAARSHLPEPHRVIVNPSALTGFGRGNSVEAVAAIATGFPLGPVRSYGSNISPAAAAAAVTQPMQQPPLPPRTHFSRPAALLPTKNAVPYVPRPKVARLPNASSTLDTDNHKDLREKCGDGTVELINGRKVCMGKLNLVKDANEVPLYGFCRSWLQNGATREFQDAVSVEHLSAQELLKGHINRAKKVRERIRRDRYKLINRYKHRLALILPSSVEQGRIDEDPRS